MAERERLRRSAWPRPWAPSSGSTELPVRLRAWDGSVAGPEGAPTVVVRSRRALRRLVWAPGELGLARAYVAGEIDVEGDLRAAFAALSSAGRLAPGDESPGPPSRERLGAAADGVRASA